jgi:hypothetical protein
LFGWLFCWLFSSSFSTFRSKILLNFDAKPSDHVLWQYIKRKSLYSVLLVHLHFNVVKVESISPRNKHFDYGTVGVSQTSPF